MKTRISLAILVSLALLAFTPPAEKYFDIAKNLDLFTTLFRELNAYYVDEIDPKSVIHTGINGMVESLDPYTEFIPEEDLETFTIQTTGQYAGVGALIGTINGKNVVTHPYENFPAHRAGIRVGDEIISVDGKNVKGKSTFDISSLLKGGLRSDVTLLIRRLDKEYTFNLTREQIKISNIAYEGIIAKETGYIKLEDFTPGAAKEVEDAVVSLKKQGATRLILDLRDNPGGLLYEAVNLVNLFIPKGQPVVETRGKLREWNKSYVTLNPPLDLNIPLVILVSGGSASASEIVAGALQDYDRAALVGEKTFGKGLVQTTRQLGYRSQLKVTTAKYYIPSGRCIQALDYTHRKKDGTVQKVEDSLKVAFKTKNGRTVYDGGGLDPDFPVHRQPYGSAVLELSVSGMFFDYATRYCQLHPQLKVGPDFKLSDAEYQAFGQWLTEKKFVYTTTLEKDVDKLISEARQARRYEELQGGLQSIKRKVADHHAGFMTRFRDEIQPLLEEEIGFHTGLRHGRVEVSLDHDPDLLEAKRILATGASVPSILKSN